MRRVVGARELAEKARRAEAAGFALLTITDHIGMEQLAPIPALAVAAAATRTLRIAPFVLNNDLRHPAVVAQDLATLDVLSGGRLEVGLGAGWNEAEYRTAGIAYQPGRERVARLEEAIAVLKGLFGGQPFSFPGRHYCLDGLAGLPRPVQRPHPPLLVGGGSRRLLTMAAREADIVGIAPSAGAPRPSPSARGGGVAAHVLAATEDRVRWVREAAGDRLPRLEINLVPPLGGGIVVTDEPAQAARELADRYRTRFGVTIGVDELLDSPLVLIGTVHDLVARLRDLRHRFGISSIMAGELDDRLTPLVERLAGT